MLPMKEEYKMKCINCLSKVDYHYRMNQHGDVFCDDDCYEAFFEENDSCGDDGHPYIDDYESIRSNYIDWVENWENDLVTYTGKRLMLKIDEMLDTLDEVFDCYGDYYRSEGDDGVFAREIYFYLLKFIDLQKVILQWRPKRKVLFYLSFELDDQAFDDRVADWHQLSKHLRLIRAHDLNLKLKKHVYSPDKLSFYFKTKRMLDSVLSELNMRFHDSLSELQTDHGHFCDGKCQELLIVSETPSYQDGWFFCHVCKLNHFPGSFTKEQLQQEIQFYDKWKNRKAAFNKAEWPYFLRKVKRSCRLYELGFPEWIELHYDI
jgi:hypothetical protein